MEYTAVLGLVAAALAAAGAAGGLDGVGHAVAAGVRTGICIVAGDVCRASDAEAAGLSPCTVREHSRGSAGTVVLASLRLGGGDEWTVASRSDGSVLVTQAEDRTVGASTGLGVEASPLGVELGVEGKYELVLGSGRTWELPDAEAARRFFAAPDSRPPPAWRFGDADSVLAGGVVAKAGGVELTGVEASASMAAGLRVGRGRTTLYLRGRLDGPGVSLWTPGGTRRAPGPTTGDVVVEVTREREELRELAFRTVERGARSGEVVETVGRLDLRSPANRAAVEPLLRWRAPWPPAVARDLRAAALRTVQAGTVERAVYGVREHSTELDLEIRLGVALGIDVERVELERRLLEASAWTPGSRERDRVDCEPRANVNGAG